MGRWDAWAGGVRSRLWGRGAPVVDGTVPLRCSAPARRREQHAHPLAISAPLRWLAGPRPAPLPPWACWPPGVKGGHHSVVPKPKHGQVLKSHGRQGP